LPLAFSGASNLVTSGGYLPNQLSILLGFGALLGLVFSTLMRGPRKLQIVVIAMTVGFIAQELLTFSRGWVPSVLAAALAFCAHLTGTPWALRRFLGWGAACALSVLVLLPGLHALTGEQLLSRFTNTSTSGRIRRVQGEFRAFREHPLAARAWESPTSISLENRLRPTPSRLVCSQNTEPPGWWPSWSSGAFSSPATGRPYREPRAA